jgi:hypothetical protein
MSGLEFVPRIEEANGSSRRRAEAELIALDSADSTTILPENKLDCRWPYTFPVDSTDTTVIVGN